MKTILALGLVMLSLLLAPALRRIGSGPHPVPDGNPAPAQSQQMPEAAHAALRTTRQAQPVHPLLLAAIEAETDPDRRSEAIERVVKSVSDADLPAALDSLARDLSPAAVELGQLLVRRWAGSDAPAAAAWLRSFPES